MKRILLLDMDGVIADFTGLLLKEAKKVIKDPILQALEYSDLDGFYLEDKIQHLGLIEKQKFEKIFTSPEFFWRLDLIPGAIQAIKVLSEHYEVFFCSSPLSARRGSFWGWLTKITWVDQKIGRDWANRVILTRDKTLIHGDILIDDKPRISGINPNPAWKHVLFKQPWNINDLKGRPVIEDWLCPKKFMKTLKDLTL